MDFSEFNSHILRFFFSSWLRFLHVSKAPHMILIMCYIYKHEPQVYKFRIYKKSNGLVINGMRLAVISLYLYNK